MQVFPNPVGNLFYISLEGFSSSTASVFLYNAAGQLLYKKNILLVNGSEYIEMPAAQLAAGGYFLKITAGKDFRFVKKLLK
ncbi:MAG: T9SS type A sorting domain-containing protein [Chitinophagaceae bacterium]|nr:T9SS type A sorting domain-containing protein [Chitinophagaceae bacterium]